MSDEEKKAVEEAEKAAAQEKQLKEEKKAVEEAEKAAAQEKQLKEEEEARKAADDAENELQAKYDALEEENKKIAAERDNYRKGLLKAKGKKTEDEDEGDDDDSKEDIDSIVERKINEKLLSSKEFQLQKEKDELTKKALKENKELKLALKTKSATSSAGAGQGGNQDQKGSDKSYFSEAQTAEIKSREQKTGVKIDLKKLEENMRRATSK